MISKYSKALLAGASSKWSWVVEIDQFAAFPLLSSRLRKLQKWRRHITTTHRPQFVPAPTRMTWNDLECRIHLKVRFTDVTLDVRVLWLSELAMRDSSQVKSSSL